MIFMASPSSPPPPASTKRKPVAIILGYGDNIGSAVAQKFKEEGFNVAVASRTLDPDALRAQGYLGITVDLVRVDDIAKTFSTVEAEYGPASVVIYNGRSHPLRPR